MKKLIYFLTILIFCLSCTCTPQSNIIYRQTVISHPVASYVTSDGQFYSVPQAEFTLKSFPVEDSLVDVSYYFDSEDYNLNKTIVNEWPAYEDTLNSVILTHRKNYKDGVWYSISKNDTIVLTITRADIALDKLLHYPEAYSNSQFRDMIIVCRNIEMNKKLLE